MNNFAQASLLLRGGTLAAEAAASPHITAGTTALYTFLEAIGRPA